MFTCHHPPIPSQSEHFPEPLSGKCNTGVTSIPQPPPDSRIKHADLWFCDGSVILQADSTLFRVHKSQLSRRSTVFSDMFTLPQPPVMMTHATLADETYEGCPVVTLYDSAEDVANLLLALYDGPFVLVFVWKHCVSADATSTQTESLATMIPTTLPLFLVSFDYLRNTQ
jgi:hypothetical protein